MNHAPEPGSRPVGNAEYMQVRGRRVYWLLDDFVMLCWAVALVAMFVLIMLLYTLEDTVFYKAEARP